MADLGKVPCEQCGRPLQVTARAMAPVDGLKAWVRVHVDTCECGWEATPTLPDSA